MKGGLYGTFRPVFPSRFFRRVTLGNAYVCPHGCCSKSFGESTPHREAYRAHSSPNSPISPRLVKPPPLEGPARHIVHQTFWHKASERYHNAFQQLAHGTHWLANTSMASSMAVVPNRLGIYPS